MDKSSFTPKLWTSLKGYTKEQFFKDLMSGIIVGIVALPLAIAFGIASGVTPEKGLVTAIIAGFVISAFGGSKVQIGGPTGAFIVIVYGIVQQFGVDGLILATFMAGVMLVLMGFARLGAVIKFIPHPLIVGFTTGIAVIIFSSQIKDGFGLKMGPVPADLLHKWREYGLHFSTTDFYALGITVATIAVTQLWPRINRKIPGPLIAILFTTLIAYFLKLPVETIGKRFGEIKAGFPAPVIPHFSLATVQSLIRPAFTIALLGGIESLLSAVVADGMIGGNHRSNMELIAQGMGNMASSIFGGIPATGAIARTATNIKNGGRTPIAGIIHSITLLLILLFVGRWAALIPMATLAGILIIVAYNMSEWENFLFIARGAKSDAAVLIVTFLLTIFVDLTVAIEIGMVFAAFLFMAKMNQFSSVKQYSFQGNDRGDSEDALSLGNFEVPKGVVIFEINGPLFFGAAYKFKDAIRIIEEAPKVLVVRMRNVPIIDATGIRTLEEVEKSCKKRGIKLMLSEISNDAVMEELGQARMVFKIGKGNILKTLQECLDRAQKLISDS